MDSFPGPLGITFKPSTMELKMSATMKTVAAAIGVLLLAATAQAAHPDPAKAVLTAAKSAQTRLVEPTVHPGGRHNEAAHKSALRAQAERDRETARR
jgi:hypothetical protein